MSYPNAEGQDASAWRSLLTPELRVGVYEALDSIILGALACTCRIEAYDTYPLRLLRPKKDICFTSFQGAWLKGVRHIGFLRKLCFEWAWSSSSADERLVAEAAQTGLKSLKWVTEQIERPLRNGYHSEEFWDSKIMALIETGHLASIRFLVEELDVPISRKALPSIRHRRATPTKGRTESYDYVVGRLKRGQL